MAAPTSLEDEREAVSELGREMLDTGLTAGTGGNVSIRLGDRVAVSPSGVPYEAVTPDLVPIITVDGEQLEGDRAPSSESPMHTLIYQARSDAGAIVHTHSPYACTFASLGKPIPASYYLIAFAGDQVPVAGYAHPGTEELGALAVDALGTDYNACLLKHHGVMAVGETGEDAFEVALMVEFCARVHYQAAAIGTPELLGEEEIHRLREKFDTYGQRGSK